MGGLTSPKKFTSEPARRGFKKEADQKNFKNYLDQKLNQCLALEKEEE